METDANPATSPLLTDFYQLAMMQTYLDHGMHETAVFELFVRRLPPKRGFLVAAGLDQALAFLESSRFGSAELDWLRGSGRFHSRFVDWLGGLEFSGEVHALPEGTVFFPNEPLLRVIAPLPEAQLVETRLLNLIHYQTLIASKAARCVLAAPGKLLVEFGLRRAHGAESGILAARASYVAGFAGTSAVLAGALFGLPLYGTMAHSFVQAHEEEVVAFERFARSHPENAVLLIDTYDTLAAAAKTAGLARRLRNDGIRIRAVRIDSGDLAEHALRVREILDDAGATDVGIFASGDMDEYRIRDVLARAAPIDAFGIGTRLATSADAPSLDLVYKLQEYAGRPRRKQSAGKETWPGRKQVYRRYDASGRMQQDVVGLADEAAEGEPLLRPVMQGGRRTSPSPSLAAVREHAAEELRRLPDAQRALRTRPVYPVKVSRALRALAAATDRDLRR